MPIPSNYYGFPLSGQTDVCAGLRALSCREEFLDVFAEQVGFEIHRITDLALAQRRHIVSVGNDPDAETFLGDCGDGEADAVQCNRTFEHEVTHHLRGRGDFKDVIRAVAFPAADSAGAINV